MNNFHYYADLNPRYGQRYQRRWAVFLSRGKGDFSQTQLHFTTRKAAERNADKLNAQEADPAVPTDAEIDAHIAKLHAQEAYAPCE